jgi:hypothetical protein
VKSNHIVKQTRYCRHKRRPDQLLTLEDLDVCVCERERQRERERERETETDRQTDRQRQRQRLKVNNRVLARSKTITPLQHSALPGHEAHRLRQITRPPLFARGTRRRGGSGAHGRGVRRGQWLQFRGGKWLQFRDGKWLKFQESKWLQRNSSNAVPRAGGGTSKPQTLNPKA